MTQTNSADEDKADRPDGVVPTAAPLGERVVKERTVQVSLRLPAAWVKMLRQRALAAAAAEDAIITPQEIVRRMIALALKPEP